MRALATIAATLLATPALAGSVAVVVHTQGGSISREAVESVTWHALYTSQGHDAVFFRDVSSATVDAMVADHLESLLEVDVTWVTDTAVDVQEHRVTAARAPVVRITEHHVVGDRLYARTRWDTFGAVAVYAVSAPGVDAPEYVAMPEVSLQQAMTLAVDPVTAPVWSEEAELIRVPVIAAADEEYRSFYGPAWPKIIQRRIDRANAMLRPAGIRLHVTETTAWTSTDRARGLSALLDDLAAQPRTDARAIRIGFTQQTDLATAWQRDVEDVGRAFTPGRDVLIADQALPPGHEGAWDEVEESIAVAHEVLHCFGVPHLTRDHLLMSGRKTSTVHALDPSTIRLARTAAEARFTHWDPITAVIALGEAAEENIVGDPGLQRDYIADNLARGPGVPPAEEVSRYRLSALTNVALGHHYLRLAADNPADADKLRSSAAEHARKALEQRPAYDPANELLALATRITLAGHPASDLPAHLPAPAPPEECPDGGWTTGSRVVPSCD